ncbi:hypothetical protein L1987_14909 [Smallanthus sonchifolius]|uniref:Uncharacterized protein n=1 Tax=Smallanthus sonchifolius TaxID=185202 RepID=A0ACB9J5N0_9ASTR|nr:hypothetical protein L1987_14909 [Smallanthus sonchifolius]
MITGLKICLLHYLYPNLFSMTKNKRCLVKESYTEMDGVLTWNIEWKRNIGEGVLWQQWLQLKDRLQMLIISDQKDAYGHGVSTARASSRHNL